MPQLICQNLCLGYDGHEIVHDLSFEVNAGDYLCIVGENGSGKSTLMKTILSLQSSLSGSVTTGDGLLKNEIGYLPQQTPVQRDFPASVWEIVLSGCQGRRGFKPFYDKDDRRLAQSTIKKMNLEALTKRCYRELSGGQQQRVMLARALCATEKILLLDEPVTGLDPKASQEMYSCIRELNGEGTTVIMITHDINAANLYANRILHLGKRVFFGTKEEYFKSIAPEIYDRGGEEI